jgi:hypothetical protein
MISLISIYFEDIKVSYRKKNKIIFVIIIFLLTFNCQTHINNDNMDHLNSGISINDAVKITKNLKKENEEYKEQFMKNIQENLSYAHKNDEMILENENNEKEFKNVLNYFLIYNKKIENLTEVKEQIELNKDYLEKNLAIINCNKNIIEENNRLLERDKKTIEQNEIIILYNENSIKTALENDKKYIFIYEILERPFCRLCIIQEIRYISYNIYIHE